MLLLLPLVPKDVIFTVYAVCGNVIVVCD